MYIVEYEYEPQITPLPTLKSVHGVVGAALGLTYSLISALEVSRSTMDGYITKIVGGN